MANMPDTLKSTSRGKREIEGRSFVHHDVCQTTCRVNHQQLFSLVVTGCVCFLFSLTPQAKDETGNTTDRDVLPSGKNQSACWMMGSIIATTWTDVAAAISARVLRTNADSERTGGGSAGLIARS